MTKRGEGTEEKRTGSKAHSPEPKAESQIPWPEAGGRECLAFNLYIVYIHCAMAPAPRISIDSASSIPVYRQIASGLRQHLVEGRLRPGDLLPPVRQLALDLGVHFNTVALAYRSLAEEGWLDLRRRRGALVLERDTPVAPVRDQVDRLLRRLGEVTAELRTAGVPPRRIAAALRRLAEGVEP